MVTPRHEPRKTKPVSNSNSIVVEACLPRHYIATAVFSLFVSTSLPSNWSMRHNIKSSGFWDITLDKSDENQPNVSACLTLLSCLSYLSTLMTEAMYRPKRQLTFNGLQDVMSQNV
jgi:hypothetical protein